MRNKFKRGQLVSIKGIGKCNGTQYKNVIGKAIGKDDFFWIMKFNLKMARRIGLMKNICEPKGNTQKRRNEIMKILSLKTNGFRKFEGDFETKFYNTTYILGGNHKGKTNILFAIVWAMLGSNLTGDERVCFANKTKSEYYVELIFEDNQNIKHTIIRYKNKYDNSKNFLTLDGKIAKQEDLINFYHNKNLFLAIINLSYFVGLQPAKQRELIDKYLPNVDIKSVYDKLPTEDKKILDVIPSNVKLYIGELENEIKFTNNKITNLKGQIEYAKKIEIETSKKSLGIEIEHLEQDRQEVWLDLFEKDKRQWAYLFEVTLLTGARPEEGCGFKWSAMDFEKDIVHINNAYKDIILYDENMKKIGHERGDGTLKTDESYRDIPMHPRLKRLLLMIKAERMLEYKKLGKKWDENNYIFLNEKNEPFVSEMLTNKMPTFIKKYNLEHLTVYGLRYSFATLCSTLGMPPEVLHVIMGHADFDTTRKYYIHITEERKRNEMLKMYMKQNSEERLQELIAESDKYFGKIVQLRVQDIRSEKRLAS